MQNVSTIRSDGRTVWRKQTDAILLPDLIEVGPALIAAAFRLMKLIPAKYVVEKAWRDGMVDPEVGVVETSSGTYALGLGMVCAELGLPFHVFGDAVIDAGLRRRLEALGGHVEVVSKNARSANLQRLRMQALRQFRRQHPTAFWPRQYDNPDNRLAYAIFADHLLKRVGRQFTLVGTVGSGGSTCGTIQALRLINPAIRLIGVDTFGSVLFGLPNGERTLRGLGNSLHPKNLRHECFDEVHWVSAAEAFGHTRMLHGQAGLYMGPTSGAAYQVARWVAVGDKTNPVVFIAADDGYRYQDTVYDDAWLAARGLAAPRLDVTPVTVASPTDARAPWAQMAWRRRTLQEVVAGHG